MTAFRISQSPDLKSLEGLDGLTDLTYLDIVQEEPTIRDLAPVGGLTDLEYLRLHGGPRNLAVIENLHALRNLDFYKLPKKNIPVLAEISMPHLPSLVIRGLSAPDLTCLAGFAGLKALYIWQSRVLKDLSGLEKLAGLQLLGLSEIGRIDSLGPIAALPDLARLSISGGIWGTQKLKSLAPLAGLHSLVSLEITNIELEDRDLRPLFVHRALDAFDFYMKGMTIEDVVRIAASQDIFLGYLETARNAGFGGCETCGAPLVFYKLPKVKSYWCPSCEGDRLAKIRRNLMDRIRAARDELPPELRGSRPIPA